MPVHEAGICILSGPVRSGKTSSLFQWIEKVNASGILTPVVNGVRMFMNVQSREQFPMEAREDEMEVLIVGRFRFNKKGFEKAIQIIKNAIPQTGWLIIDEIGPLELNGEGFHDILQEVLKNRQNRILLVVREGFARKVQDHFGFEAIVIPKTDLQ